MFKRNNIILVMLFLALLTLSSCAVAYNRQQAPAAGLPNCFGLHMNNAKWYFNDEHGNRIDVIGRCSQGRMHGNFEYFVNNVLVATTKFVNNQETKTACYVGNKHRTLLLASCMSEFEASQK